jgi:hypothetical protein
MDYQVSKHVQARLLERRAPWWSLPAQSIPVTIRPLEFCNEASPGRTVPWRNRPLDDPSPGLTFPWMKCPLDKPSPGWHIPINFVTKRPQIWGRTVRPHFQNFDTFFVTKHLQRQVWKMCWFTQWLHPSTPPFTLLMKKKPFLWQNHPLDAAAVAAAANHAKFVDFTKICQPTNILMRIFSAAPALQVCSSGGSGPLWPRRLQATGGA